MSTRAERRTSQRYSIERRLRYRLRGVRPPLVGTGVTLNMSSGGVLFTTEEPLTKGKPVVLEINWPVLLNESRPLKLVTRGRVVWCENEKAAMSIDGWEFRTLVAEA